MISTYFGSITIVLKLPLTRAASTNGLQRYSGFWTLGVCIDGEAGGAESVEAALGNVVEVGVGERLGPLGPERCMERLRSRKKKRGHNHIDGQDSWYEHSSETMYRAPYGVKKRHHLPLDGLRDWMQYGEHWMETISEGCRPLSLESPWRLSRHVFIRFNSVAIGGGGLLLTMMGLCLARRITTCMHGILMGC
jgi:hypothetical protein